MSHVLLIHWSADAARGPANALRRSKHTVEIRLPRGAPSLASARESPPDVFVIDLRRRPSEGRA
ncbi:MAG: hypothetical protein ACYTG6_09120, partial [Planctomycetota bacterium]